MKKILSFIYFLIPTIALGADFHIGPGQTYTTIGAFQWYQLKGGDTVYIHYKPTPYYEKFLISSRGSPTNWIRVIGVKGPNGELPIISGDNATTGSGMNYRSGWQDPGMMQWGGVVQVAHGDNDVKPGYIEIANLQIQDGYEGYNFTAENGQPGSFDGFSAGVYIRGSDSVWVRDCIITNNGQGIFTWSTDGPGDAWWEAYCKNIRVSGTYFFNNGHSNSYTEHQIYMQALDPVIEFNRFGPMRNNSLGSQLKTRSAGDIIRYNYIEQCRAGYNIDLIEPQDMYTILQSPHYAHDFIYGNILMDNTGIGGNMIHYNEDHYGTDGRLREVGGKLSFYNNTILVRANRSDFDEFYVFIGQHGGYDCPAGPLPGRIDMRNNIIASIPRTTGSQAPIIKLGYCGNENIDLGVNWISPGWGNYVSSPRSVSGGTVTGAANVVSPANNDPGFVDAATGDVHLTAGSSARGIGGVLAQDVTSNVFSLDLTPYWQYYTHQRLIARVQYGVGSDAGALGFQTSGGPIGDPPSRPGNPPANGGGGSGGGGGGTAGFLVLGNQPAQFNCPGSGNATIWTLDGAKVAELNISGGLSYSAPGLASGTYPVKFICDGAETNTKLVVVR